VSFDLAGAVPGERVWSLVRCTHNSEQRLWPVRWQLNLMIVVFRHLNVVLHRHINYDVPQARSSVPIAPKQAGQTVKAAGLACAMSGALDSGPQSADTQSAAIFRSRKEASFSSSECPSQEQVTCGATLRTVAESTFSSHISQGGTWPMRRGDGYPWITHRPATSLMLSAFC